MRGTRLVLLAGFLISACAPAAAPRGASDSTDTATAVTTAPAASPIPLTVASSRYGALEVKTLPLDTCEVAIKVDRGSFGDGPPRTLAGRADATGVVSWIYPAPLIPAGHGRHEVTCSGAEGTRNVWSEFDVSLKSLDAKGFDGSQRILVFMVDDLGPVSTENSVAVALHELGHIWCCRGPDAGADGHWLEAVADPLLQGVDRFGLMTHPVTCQVFPGFVTCPNRFSERELHAMGFADVPAPPADACVTKVNALVAQINALDASLASSRATIETTTAQLTEIEGRISAIERQYPGRVLPPDVYPTYTALIDQYNRLLADNNAHVDAFNRDVEQRNALARQPLRC